MLILGGAGSLGGVILGALVVNVSLEAAADAGPRDVDLLRSCSLATLVAKLRPWQLARGRARRHGRVRLRVHAIVAAVWPRGDRGRGVRRRLARDALAHWVPLPTDARIVGNIAFVALVARRARC